MIGPILLLTATQAVSLPPSPPDTLVQSVRTLADRLTAEDAGSRARAEEKLLALGPQAAEPLLNVAVELAQVGPSAKLEATRSVLSKYGAAAVEPLWLATRRISYQLREPSVDEAAAAVARMGEAAVPELDKLLDRGYLSDPVQLAPPQAFAMRTLREMGPLGSLHLIRLLNHPKESVRGTAAALLANVSEYRAVDALLKALKSEDGTVRMYAARGLGDLRDRRAIEALVGLLSDSDWGPRRAAALALAKMYEPRFLMPLVRLARADPQPLVRQSAANGLIHWSHDRTAARVGLRYRPAEGFIQPETVRLRNALRLAVTGLVVYLLFWVGARLSDPKGTLKKQRSVWWALVLLALFGFLWGRVFVNMTETLERQLLLVCLPATLLLAVLAGPRLKWLAVSAGGLVLTILLFIFAPYLGTIGFLAVITYAPWIVVGTQVVALIVAWRTGKRVDHEVRRHFRTVAFLGAVLFYAGYGLGWLALWGYVPL